MWNILCPTFLVLVLVICGNANQDCRKYDWKCRDGSCIKFDGKCDGIVDCPDASDETHALCRNTPCHLFRCTYGACVDSTAPCNGVQECMDNSDELIAKCRNETRIVRDKFICDDGQLISITGLCDGLKDCIDGSDETIQACAGNVCPSHLFQCAYGACVDKGSNCDEKQDCADTSDESDELCNRISNVAISRSSVSHTTPSPVSGACVLPPYPDNGRYEVEGDPFAQPGKKFNSAMLKVVCDTGYAVDGNNVAVCFNGTGFKDIPKCSRYCDLHPKPSVTYSCVTIVGDSQTTRPCKEREFPGTKVVPKCKEPHYYGTLSNMICEQNGSWRNFARCTADCGKITPVGQQYVIDGKRAKHGELPWHAGIYRKNSVPYTQICGGSLVTTTTVITAAHCFWDDVQGKLPAENFAVGLGKVYRPWDDEQDIDSQLSNVSAIHIPSEFHGALTNFQSDIAVVVLETEIVYQTFIRPVCMSFDSNLNSMQLRDGNLGKIAGWGLTAADGDAAPVLQTVELPFVGYKQCFDESPEEFRPYISVDKFCAGFKNGTTLCQGDSGGGLVFPVIDHDYKKYYLRGIVSTAPRNNQKCDPYVRVTFTSIVKHIDFIKDHVNLND